MSALPPASPIEPTDDIHDAIRIAQGARTKPKVAITIVVILAATIVTAGWLAGWFTPTPAVVPPKTCAGQVLLEGAGAPAVTPAMRVWSAEYNTTVCAKVAYATNSSGLGELASKTVDFAAIDAPLSASQAAELGAGAFVLPVALEALVVAYNVPGVPSGLHLTGGVLAAIFLGNITNWNSPTIQALNPGDHFPSNLPITTIHRSDGSTATLVFTGYLSRANATWNATVGTNTSVAWPLTGGEEAGEHGSPAEVADINETLGGIGYAELPLVQQANLPSADLQNPDGSFVAASAANTSAAASAANPTLPPETGVPSNQSLVDENGTDTYPMATLSYVVVYKDVGAAYGGALTKNEAQWLGAYVLWVTTAAQPLGATVGYAPLPAMLITWNQDSLEGLQYYGQSVLAGGDFDGGL
jgi:phosphate transport system substrate-binding protein